MLARAIVALTLALAFIAPAQAQDSAVSGQVLVIDSDRLYVQSQLGRKIEAKLSVMRVALAAEQRSAEEELEAEELALTQKRKTMTPQEFQPLAEAFDKRVQEIRKARTNKVSELEARQITERESFLQSAGPILRQLLEEKGATVILERRATFFSSNSVDITDEAIARLDAEIAKASAESGGENESD